MCNVAHAYCGYCVKGSSTMEWAVSTVHMSAEQNFSSAERWSTHRSPPAEKHGLVHSAERRKLFSAHVSHCNRCTPAHIIWPLVINAFIPLFHTLTPTASKYFTPCELRLLNGSINDLKPQVHLHNICILNFYFKPNTWIPMTNTIWLMVFNDILPLTLLIRNKQTNKHILCENKFTEYHNTWYSTYSSHLEEQSERTVGCTERLLHNLPCNIRRSKFCVGTERNTSSKNEIVNSISGQY